MSDTDQTEDPMRAFAQALFARAGDDEADEPDEQPKPAGYVAREGNNPNPGPDPDKDMRAFVKDLFNNDNPW